MRRILADHTCNVFLKPGEVIVSANPILVSTVLGSCVTVTMYSPEKRVGAICHAMLPNNHKENDSLLYVDTAVRYTHRKMKEYGVRDDLVVKLFGGARVLVLVGGNRAGGGRSVGEQNVIQAKKTLEQLGLAIAKADTGGTMGRKLFFSIKTGEVFLRKLRLNGSDCPQTVWP